MDKKIWFPLENLLGNIPPEKTTSFFNKVPPLGFFFEKKAPSRFFPPQNLNS